MKLMKYDVIPRKYQLSWDSNHKAIGIEVHKDCIGQNTFDKYNPLILHLKEDLKIDGLFDSFSGDLSADFFGFDRAIMKVNEYDQYVRFEAALPYVRTNTNMACPECGGTGTRTDFKEDTCLYCFGRKVMDVYDWRAGFVVTASLGLLFMNLDIAEETSSQDPQHAMIHLICEHGQHGSSLGGDFGIAFSDYLKANQFELERILLPNALDAMKTAYALMFGDKQLVRGSMRDGINDSVRDGYLLLNCPGDACGIHFCDHDSKIGQGREFSCHNVDTPVQCLTLLVGIASLVGQSDIYIRALQGKKQVPA